MEKHLHCSEPNFKSNISISGNFVVVLHLSGISSKSEIFSVRAESWKTPLRDMAMSAQCLRSMQINLAPEEGRSNAALAMGIRSHWLAVR